MNGHKYPREWENINGSLQRIRVPKGWLIRSSRALIVGNREVYASEDLMYYSDPEYEWQLEQK